MTILLITVNGRMAYTIMCVEAFLKATHPDRDWTLLSTKMWEATSSNWGDWPDMFCGYIPHVLLQYDTYDADDLESSMTEQEFHIMKNTYNGITIGDEDNPNDEVLLSKNHFKYQWFTKEQPSVMGTNRLKL